MSESLIIEGKQYISSRRAAEIAGYSNDYIGQLCRSGKLICKMVGRFWYVNEGSLLKHKNDSVKPNQTIFKKKDLSGEVPVVEIVSQEARIDAPPAWKITDLSGAVPGQYSWAPSPHILLAPTAAGIALILALMSSGMGRSRLSFPGSAATANVAAAVQSAGQELVSAWSSFFSGAASLATRLYSGGQPAANPVSQAPEEPAASSVIPPADVGKVTSEHGGLVVLPATGASTTEAKLEKSIQNSFSDTVVIRPNSDGTTGVIQPVFRTVAGHDFLYVLVPVKATSTSAVN